MKQSRMEVVKTAVIAVLLVSLVCLCSLYMLSYQGISDAEFGKGQMDRLGGKSVKYQYVKYTDASLVFPEFMGLSDGERHYGFLGEGQAFAELYADVYRFYTKLFGAEGHMERLTREEGEALFAAAYGDEYIFVRYACDLPKSILMGMTGEDGTALGVSGEFLSELFILPDTFLYDGMTVGAGGATVRATVYSFYAVARDEAGNYYRYTTSYLPTAQDDIGYHQKFFIAYTAMGEARRYAFAAEKDDAFFEGAGLSRLATDTTVLFDMPLVGAELSLLRVFPDEEREMAILKAFMMNPERISSYTDESGTRAYFDEGKSVRFLNNGEVRFAALGQSGVTLDEVFGFHSSGGDYDAFDSVGAALLLADSLGIQSEGKGTVYLCGMGYDGRRLTLLFGYRYGGIPLFADGREDVFRIEIEDGAIVSVSFRLISLEETGKTVSTSDLTFTLRGYLTNALTRHKLLPMLSFEEGAEKGGVSVVAVSLGRGEAEE